MATYSLKKSYQLKDLEEIKFYNHLKNLISSLKKYQITNNSLKADILKVIKNNLSKNKKYNHLLRIAVNKKIISISLRKRIKPKLNFNLKLVKLKREQPQFKNLKYKKILSYLSKIDNSKSDVALVYDKKILETGTSNLLFVKGTKFFTPKKDYYQGNTYKFFKTKINKIRKKDILLKEINEYDEIILIGSGKGVASVKTINQLNWKRKNLNKFKFLSNQYDVAINKCNTYRF